MNILPKKRWHVRTKENIARVKQDEAKFEEEKRKKEDRSLLAEQESRTEFLRKQQHARLTPGCSASSNNRVALLSDRSVELIEGNKEYEAEKKAEQEAQEKSIGLLTYLGQSMLDSGGQKPWYDIHPKKRKLDDAEKLKAKEEWEAKKKLKADPLSEMNRVSEWFEKKRMEKAREEAKLLQKANSCIAAMPSLFPNDISVPKPRAHSSSLHQAISEIKSKHRKSKSKERAKPKHAGSDSEHSPLPDPDVSEKSFPHNNSPDHCSKSSKSVPGAVELAKQMELDRMRAERLQRERRERERAAVVMAKAMGLSTALADPPQTETPTDERQLPFNSAFNPELSAALAERRQRWRESKRNSHL